MILNNLAASLQAQLKSDDAERIFKRTILLSRKLNAEPTPLLAGLLGNLAAVQSDQRKFKDAAQTLGKSLAMKQKVHEKEAQDLERKESSVGVVGAPTAATEHAGEDLAAAV